MPHQFLGREAGHSKIEGEDRMKVGKGKDQQQLDAKTVRSWGTIQLAFHC